jgi:hypothetical protein
VAVSTTVDIDPISVGSVSGAVKIFVGIEVVSAVAAAEVDDSETEAETGPETPVGRPLVAIEAPVCTTVGLTLYEDSGPSPAVRMSPTRSPNGSSVGRAEDRVRRASGTIALEKYIVYRFVGNEGVDEKEAL